MQTIIIVCLQDPKSKHILFKCGHRGSLRFELKPEFKIPNESPYRGLSPSPASLPDMISINLVEPTFWERVLRQTVHKLRPDCIVKQCIRCADCGKLIAPGSAVTSWAKDGSEKYWTHWLSKNIPIGCWDCGEQALGYCGIWDREAVQSRI